MKIKVAFHWLVFAACIAGWITELTQAPIKPLSTILGIGGAIYCLFYVVGLFLFPVKRDWVMMKGNFLLKVVNFVLLVPFVLTLLLAGSQSSDILQLEESSGNGGCCHMAECGAQEEQDYSLFWSVYSHYIAPGNQHMAGTEKGRQYVALITILGYILLNGVLISTLVSWFDRRREQWIKGEIVYNRFSRRWPRGKKHYVIIGGSDVAIGVVRQLFNNHEGREPYVIVQTSSDIDTFRRELFSTLTERQQMHLVLYYGSSTSKDDLAKLGLNNAAEVYLLGENTRPDDTDSYHDTVNMECLEQICDIIQEEKNKKRDRLCLKKCKETHLLCRVMFEYQTTFSVFQLSDISNKIKNHIKFRPINYYEMWAQKVLINKEINPAELKKMALKGGYLPLEGTNGITQKDSDYVHLFVVGMSRMGVAMAIEAAHLAHYPNYTEQNKIRTKITFIDANAAEQKDFFMGRFKELFKLSHWRYGTVEEGELVWKQTSWPEPEECDYLGGDFLDVEWEFIHSGIEQEVVQEYILSSANPNARVTIAICLPESNKAHAAALYFDKRIYESDRVLQVLVYNRNGDAIVKSLRTENIRAPYHNKLKAFGSSKDCFDLEYFKLSEQNGENIGKKYCEIKTNYINPAIDKANLQEVEERNSADKKYGGKSDAADYWSNIYNANTMWTKLRSVNFDGTAFSVSKSEEDKRSDVEVLSDVEHNRWNMEQLLMHFRPLTSTEQAEVLDRIKSKNELKNNMAHLDICSNKCLNEKISKVDVVARAYDVGLTELLPELSQKKTTSKQ